ncbi:MAG: SH3 domain-containing protein [Deltaproteobacteria bacterium]|nr:SH3 domain-containing protein [Deltaproteobacteria bacterium]
MKLFSKVLIPVLAGVFLFSCAAVERVTQPTAKSTSQPGTGPTIEQAQKEDYMGPKARVAVTRFEDKSAKGKPTGEIGDGMAEMLSNALFASNRFIVLERQALGDVLQEQDIGASGRLKTKTVAPIGEIEGADLLIRGTITEFEPGSAGAGGAGVGVGPGGGIGGFLAGIRTSHVAMIVKVIDAKTARILASEQVEGKATDILGGIGGAGGGLAGAFGMYSKTPMEKAIRVAIEESVRLIVAKTPKEYYRVPATPVPKATLPPPKKPTQPQEAQPQPQPQPQAALPPQPTVVTPPPIVRVTQVIVSSENLRDGPAGKIIGKVPKGTSLAILEEKGNWLRVRLEDGREAWIWKASTSEEAKASPAPATTPTAPKGKSPM